ncbi:metal dependent phosphohydrolase [Solidesulfovibrio fructosivorans JJ]]|uniref:Metal dependent phosphohydrolase n=1 Tax=Solidesulfovibrio fructosivorans JJ] TaxID=596151 RepID=E1K020_SOLFR|nr:HD domain-containing phosphohydrolase [Solidesulfovibrio fructosivorans]EFL50026.1 metal dependent phosphohydrolase [Solidesulfovibrio fructosivorans JJ]]
MIVLRRLLKKKTFSPVLDRAARLLGPGWQVTLSENAPDAADSLACETLRLEGEPIGYLVVTPPPDARLCPSEIPRLPELVRFVADTLQTLLAGEVVKRSLAAETLGKYREISLLHRATLELNDSLRPRDVAQALLDECRFGELPARSGMVFLRPPSSEDFSPACSFGDAATQRLAAIAGSTLFWDIARAQKGEIVNELGSDRRWRDEADLASLLLCPLIAANRCVGMLALAGTPDVRFEASHLQYVGTLATVAGIALGNALHFEAVQALINSLMQALATAIDARDPFTAGHSQRVARLGVALAKAVHDDTEFFPDVAYTPSDLEELLYAGLLHDVGKIGIREEVLTKATRLPAGTMEVIGQRMALEALVTGRDNKAEFEALSRINAADGITREDAALVAAVGARTVTVGEARLALLTEREIACLLIARGNLTPEERREIERHPAESHRILCHIPFPGNMGRLLTIISQHHERLDGSGYPGGLKADDILLQSRIIAIVDIYDAITMARHYKPALPREKALGILWAEARAGRIDARLVELLERHIATIERDCERLSGRMDLSEYLEQEAAPKGAGKD